jgi:hypothetical protein
VTPVTLPRFELTAGPPSPQGAVVTDASPPANVSITPVVSETERIRELPLSAM